MSALRATLAAEQTRPGLVFFLIWYIASFVGWFLEFIPMLPVQLGLGLVGVDPEHMNVLGPGMLVLAAVLGGAACGSTIGLAQWLVLRRELGRVGWWVGATIAGYASAGVLTLIGNLVQPGWLTWASTLIVNGKLHWIARLQPEPDWAASAWLPGAITLLLFGAVLGVAQWLVLRGRVRQAGWWIAASTLSWALGAAVSTAALSWAQFIFALDALPAVTGLGMMWLLRQPEPS